MHRSHTLAIDQGTHMTRALLFDDTGQAVATFTQKIALYPRSPTEVEQNPDEILSSVRQVIAEARRYAQKHALMINRAGLATQRSSVLAWDRKTGQALSPVLSWQDRRAAAWLSSFAPYAQAIAQRTGLRLSPHYGVSKLQWLRQTLSSVIRAEQQSRLALGPLASFLLHHVLEEAPFVIDHANAARTLLWNLTDCDWDPWLMQLFGIPPSILPLCCPVRYEYGHLAGYGIPLTAVNGDQSAALFAATTLAESRILVNIGTGAFILQPTGKTLYRHPRLLSGIADSHAAQTSYTLEGTVNNAGSALDWAGVHWHIPDVYQQLEQGLMTIHEPPLFINSISGLGSPWWSEGSQPQLTDLEGNALVSAPSVHILVAVTESILFLIQANLEALTETGNGHQHLVISGGLAQSDALCQKLANLSGLTVHRPVLVEATARGIAWLAAGKPADWPVLQETCFWPCRESDAQDSGLNGRYRRFLAILEKKIKDKGDFDRSE
ncbi:FGGY family carbohydrate kinase [Nitrosomonas sp. Nm132]|uniref:FGGY family carbohydrate kinase n=1 Tax=Nitrosomonas sp. Nm132 TaxID=1881053 RepID=UPI00088B1EEA|nr:FGGY family carbohydrate kinase [Nitrosomonas sp. Nm132]SDH39101.1 glycerol kinase [Nitrosomonas sp. Nm132]